MVYLNKSYDEMYIIFTPHFKNTRNCDAYIRFYKSQRCYTRRVARHPSPLLLVQRNQYSEMHKIKTAFF